MAVWTRLRLAEIMRARGVSVDLLARSARLPTAAILPLLQDPPPRRVRLAVLGRLALALDISPGALVAAGPSELVARAAVRAAGLGVTAAEDDGDDLSDLDAAFAREFPAAAT